MINIQSNEFFIGTTCEINKCSIISCPNNKKCIVNNITGYVGCGYIFDSSTTPILYEFNSVSVDTNTFEPLWLGSLLKYH